MLARHEIYFDGFLRKSGQRSNEEYKIRDFLAPKVSVQHSSQMRNYIQNIFNGNEKAAMEYLNEARRFMNTQDFFT